MPTTPTDSDAAPGETIQRTLFAGPARWVTDDLYSRITHGVALRRRSEIEMHAGAIVHTNAYFGRFEASYWQRWTRVQSVLVSILVRGEAHGVIRLRATDIAGHERTIEAVETHGAGDGRRIELTTPLDTFIDGGALWLELRAVDGTLTFADVRWSVAEEAEAAGKVEQAAGSGEAPAGADATEAPAAPAGLAIAICTFNRADDCANTVASLASDPEVLGRVDRVYVTDQGTDHVDGRQVFQDAASVIGDKLHYLRQPNLGGAGGFTRGMYEATSGPAEKHLDVLLMDDDVRIEPESILRIASFNRYAAEPVLVGAQMLYLYNPDYLLASAERADVDGLTVGIPVDGFTLVNKNVVKKRQERRLDAGYNGWWTCLIPAGVVERIGLPLPVFFQRDDVEYAVRARSRGYSTVTVPGVAVWHADFYWKDRDDFSLYFGQRNELVTAALHGSGADRRIAKTLAHRVSHSIVAMRYGQAKTYLMAIADFLDGPSCLDDGGQEAMKAVRAERARFPETVVMPIQDVESTLPIRRAVGRIKDDKADLVLAKRVAKQLTGRVERGPVAIPYEDSFWWHVSLFDEAYVTDGSQKGVRHLRRDPALARALAKEAAALLKRFRAEAPRVAEEFRAAQPQLTSRENWARLYGI